MRKIMFAIVLCCLLLAGCQSEKNVTTKNTTIVEISSLSSDYSDFSCPDCNVILISIDALRAENLGTYGYYRDTSKNIDAFAKESFVFENAYTVVAQTKPSTTSMLFGLYPYNTGIRANLQRGPPKNITINLPSELKKEGYVSAAFMGAQWLYANNSGFDKYFDYFYPTQNRREEVIAEELNEEAINWIRENKEQKFFVWIHYKDPHIQYSPPKEYKNIFMSEDVDMINMSKVYGPKLLADARVKGDAVDANYYRDQYDNEIFYTDKMFGIFMKRIEEWGLKNNTVIIVTADHGESLGEHNYYFVHVDYYDVTNKIPLILYLPNYTGKRIDSLSANIDIFPTILDLLKIKEPKNIDGVSLVPTLTNKINVRDYVFEEFYDSLANKSYDAAVKDEYNNLIINDDGVMECYNLVKDSDELNYKGCTKEKYDELLHYLIDELKKSGNTAYVVLQNKMIISENKKEELLDSLNYLD